MIVAVVIWFDWLQSRQPEVYTAEDYSSGLSSQQQYAFALSWNVLQIIQVKFLRFVFIYYSAENGFEKLINS